MATYYAYLLDETGHVASRIDLECADDEAAKERAQYLPHENGAELWLLDRLIAVLGPTVQAQHPMDVADKLEKLLTDAEDCALLSKLTADPAKRERFARLAKRFRQMARKLDTAIKASADPDDPIAPG
ncbi:hypothetical protein LRP30_36925 [Bradyrhizobium sp. C-145]|uniref:hypothetical protein n=1 Tax=Bradyrhizobium sp. C-145 TaxID=574727 RepID=UPI00201B6B27|nr:hypothetical protein [Bradyrhizobium sp. C-145]UQR62300.1 hypothetical protein LRP30_36925 [Bradyrhizobium sp. C-145]